MTRPARNRGFTLLELAVVIVFAVVLLVILLPIFFGFNPPTSRPAPQIQSSTQLRGIHQGLVIYAQSNKGGPNNPGYYPGLDAQGNPTAITVEERFKILLDANMFTPEYLINPSDTAKTAWQSGPFASGNYSYAALQVPAQGGRHEEWAETISTQAIILSDRNTGTTQQPESVWTSTGEPWKGTVTRNDGSTYFESTDTFDTKYGSVETKDDRLFEKVGDDDAYLIDTGN